MTWAALIATLAIVRPRSGLLREALRLLPDVLPGLLETMTANVDTRRPRRRSS